MAPFVASHGLRLPLMSDSASDFLSAIEQFTPSD
jgi:hypothetical protein